MAKRKKSKEERELEAAQTAMLEAVAGMAQIMTCPVLVAEEHASVCDELVNDAEQRVELAMLARDLHGGTSELEIELDKTLGDFVELMERHRRELLTLQERFAKLDDHDVAHEHLEFDDIPVAQLAECMFGPAETGEANP